ncbi:hypothetical protein BN2476_230133 [Paraburkholderia piptadeniae]|uniref:Uncharacterized protein n=1 Tax=Paraburkholderia piptadeniae TaxID=1701573 RepID=A0A1N7RX24_9BURK|nr:hypothetical protein BN2476_230133 [Paraburkholderia piptadeniae]
MQACIFSSIADGGGTSFEAAIEGRAHKVQMAQISNRIEEPTVLRCTSGLVGKWVSRFVV